MKLSERIEAAKKELGAAKDQLVAEMKALEDTPDDDAQLAKVDDITGRVEKLTAQVAQLERAEKALAEKAEAVAAAPAMIHNTKAPAGELWAKMATASFLAHVERKNIDQVIEERYTKDNALKTVRDVQKNAVPLATTFTAGWAQELVQSDVQGFLNLLTPLSVAAALAGKSMQLNFNGYDSITIPNRGARVPGATLGGAFVGEGGAIPLGRMALGSDKIFRYKMGVISTFSRELAERSTPSIEQLIRQAILEDTSIELDSAFLGALAAVPGVRPAGILNGVALTAGTAGGGVDAVVKDIKAGVGFLTANGNGQRPVLITSAADALSAGLMQSALGEFMFRDDLAGGRLLGLEVIRSQNVPVNTVLIVDAANIATAFDATEFSVSDIATVVEADAANGAPTHATGAAGAIGTAGQVPRNGGIMVSGSTGAAQAGSTARSLWQTYSVGVRAVTPVSWALLRANSVWVTATATW